jgi:predicted 3-demethylubiquinone-9 3-methyltransferase (glyoxalase superfamily)
MAQKANITDSIQRYFDTRKSKAMRKYPNLVPNSKSAAAKKAAAKKKSMDSAKVAGSRYAGMAKKATAKKVASGAEGPKRRVTKKK